MNQSASMHKLRLHAALPDDILRRNYVRAFACRGGGAFDDRRRRARERRLGPTQRVPQPGRSALQ
jgi:hypothetical protein